MKASTIALRDQILAALTDADTPLSTDQVAGAVGRTHPSRPDGFDAGQVVYRNLCALERRGICERVHVEFDRRVFWRAIASTSPELLSLERFDAAFGGESS